MEPRTRAEYADLLGTLQDIARLDATAVRRARLHYYGALNLRPVPMRSFSLDYSAGGKAEGTSNYDVILHRRADDRLVETDDLGRLIKWLTEAKSTELLSRDI